jgi:hypothetical protein
VLFAALSYAAVLAASPTGDATPPQAPRVRVCTGDAGIERAKKGTRRNLPKARKSILGDLPRPDMELSVWRKVNGCETAVKVRTGVQGDGRFAAPQLESDPLPVDRFPVPDRDAPQDAAGE